MMAIIDKRDRARMFRERLTRAMADGGFSRSALARTVGVDRSTLSQLLSRGETRLPAAQFVAEAASALGVSTDWLLGLTERPERPGDLIEAAVRVSDAQRASVDEQLLRWHNEARGYKIRHVPATLPDVLKTEALIAWEYEAFLGKTPDQALRATMDRLAWLRSGGSDYEIAIPLHEIEAFAAGEGYYRGLSGAVRAQQLDALETSCRTLYPTLRLHLFDARKLYSAPVTVFGPILAVIYVGRFYLAFRNDQRVRSLAEHFDWLVRECSVDAREVPAFIAGLRGRL